MRSRPILLALLASLPLSLVAIRAVILEVRDLRDPCLRWGESSDWGFGTIAPSSARSGDPCATRISGTSQTKAGSVVRVLLVPGGILAAAALGILGAACSRRALAVTAACLMFVEVIPLIFSVAPLAVLAGGVFLWVANRVRPARVAA